MISLNSKVTKALLGYYFLHENSRLYMNELVSILGLDKRNLSKKLKELEKEKLFKTEKKANAVYYYLNRSHPLYNEYKKIVLKTAGIELKIRDILKKAEDIEEAYLFGSYAKDSMDSASDIDVLVIGEADTVNLHEKLRGLQKSVERNINLININRKELDKRKKEKDNFIETVFKEKKIRLI